MVSEGQFWKGQRRFVQLAFHDDVIGAMTTVINIGYTRCLVDEAMRLYPPGWLMMRKALNDDTLGDYFVPAGTEIYISPYLIQRHPAFWENPDRFDPDRFQPNEPRDRQILAMLPFSVGPRKCIGEFFARIEMQFHLMTIAKQLRLRSVGGNRLEIDAGVNLRKKYDFIMTPEVKAGSLSAQADGR
jgi:cytochrome P450